MKVKSTLLSALAVLLISSGSFAQNYYCVRSSDADPSLLTVDVSNGNLIDSIGVSIAGSALLVDGFNGMAEHHTTGDLYVAIKDDNGDRQLGIINPVNGEITLIGMMDFKCSSITFDANGTLYGMAGDDTTALYTISTTDAASTLFHQYTTAGDDGEGICVNTTDGLLYRYDGGSDGVLTSLDLGTLTETIIDTLTNIDTWGPGLYYDEPSNDFTMGAGDTFYKVSTTGAVTLLSDVVAHNWDGQFKGLVKVNYAHTKELDQVSVNVYPNPSSGDLTIKADFNYTLEVVDLKGEVVQTHENTTHIIVETPGVYFLRFIGQHTSTVQKVVIK